MRYLDLCSGVGMLGLAVKMTLKMRAGIDASPIAYCEIDEYPRAVLNARMEDGSLERAPILRDVTRLPLSDLLGRVDIICAGFRHGRVFFQHIAVTAGHTFTHMFFVFTEHDDFVHLAALGAYGPGDKTFYNFLHG